ncbi:hypothetical protein HDU97_009629 [Phlyctochytrium planicorne]|nr:hypothetical protein HDU97_009629 [Phlyctochytrium planicorne]
MMKKRKEEGNGKPSIKLSFSKRQVEEEDDEEMMDEEYGDEGSDEMDYDDEDFGVEDEEPSEAEEDEEEDEEERNASELKHLQSELEDVSFENLLKVQEQMGVKQFQKIRSSTGRSAESSRTAHKKKEDPKNSRGKPEARKPKNKNAPEELSAKRSVTRKRVVVEAPKVKTRDPRFDSLGGTLNSGLFQNNYKFLNDYKKKELEMIEQRLKKEKNPEEKSALQKLHQSMTSALKTGQTVDKKKAIMKEWKKKEAEAVKKGKKPYFLKESELKKLVLVEKFKKMTPAQVEKAIEKRRKDNAASERRYLPFSRRK